MLIEEKVKAKPFLKWAGGKKQLISEIEKRFPYNIKKEKIIETYVEPFVGAGALFFYLRSNYIIENATILDTNKELMIAYKTLQRNVSTVIKELKMLEEKYMFLDIEKRAELFYSVRTTFNNQLTNFSFDSYYEDWDLRTARLIFLNKTCFNGLFRLNRKGEFNVPFGKYKKPCICDEGNLMEVHRALQGVNLVCGDFLLSKDYIGKQTLCYFDPPYRPLSQTASFTSYTKDGFCDDDQKRLAAFYLELSKENNMYLILSNSDPKNEKKDDNFFDDLYGGFTIERVEANRMINCNAEKRGRITELLIRNYEEK